MSGGKYFKMSDDESRDREPRQSQAELRQLKEQFMQRARSFMDDTALGDGKKALQKLMGRVTGEADDETADEVDFDNASADAEAEYDAVDDAEYFEDDDEYYEEDLPPKQELDWSRPEYIRAGYAKPGTEYETQRTLEDAQEESMDLKFGNLSGLLSRFGSEDAMPETEADTQKKQEMDKTLFREHMSKIYAALREQSGMGDDSLWLHPEVLTLFRVANTELKVLQFVMAALFAGTEDNYLLAADKAWIYTLMQRAGYLMKEEAIVRQIEQCFVFPERVHRLYAHLLEEPLVLPQEHLDTYAQNLAKLYIHEMASCYGADPRTVIRTLAQQWQSDAAAFQAAQQAVEPAQQQYERFQSKKMTSASLFEKLRRAEAEAERHYLQLQRLAIDIEDLKAVTRFLEEDEALAKLEQFPTAAFLPTDYHRQTMGLKDLRAAFVQLQLKNTPAPQTPETPELLQEPVTLSPVEQKHAIARSKAGEFKSLKKVFAYKQACVDRWSVCSSVPL